MSASGGAWGARHGPPLIRKAYDSGRLLAYATVFGLTSLSLAFFGLFLGFGIAWHNTLIVAVFGLPTVGAVKILVDGVLRWRSARGSRGAVIATAPSGAAATAYLRRTSSLVVPAMIGPLFALYGFGLAAVAWADDLVWVAFLAVAVGVYATALCVPFVLGRAAAGGLYLTRAGVEHRWGLTTVIVPWDKVRGSTTEPWNIGDPPRLSGEAGWRINSMRWPWPEDTLDRVPKPDVPVPMGFLPLTTRELSTLIDEFAADPQLRTALGSPASLAWEATIRARSSRPIPDGR